MNIDMAALVLNARDLAPGSCSPEQRLIMAMLAAPGAGNIWGEPAALASAVSWNRFLAAADDRLKPYLHWVSQHAPFAPLIPTVVEQTLSAARFSAGIRNLRWAAELRQLIDAFRNERRSLMLVKGSVLQRTVYPDPSTRPMSDMDLVVSRDEMPQVNAIMTRLGFRSRTSLEDFTPATGLEADEEAFFYKQIGDQILFVEIHTRLDMGIPSLSITPTQLWNQCVNVNSIDGMTIPTLEPHAALRHICLHLADHHNFYGGLLWLLDVRLFVERYKASINWGEFIRGCEPKTLPAIAFTLTLAADWLGADVSPTLDVALPVDKKRIAVSLTWGQMWDYVRSRRLPGSLTLILSGDLIGAWKYLRNRVRRWTSPIQDRRTNLLALAGKRFWSDLRYYRAAFREGGFRVSNIRAAIRSDHRANQLRLLLRSPMDK